MIAWYSRNWSGSLGYIQAKILPELDKICGVVFDDDVTPAQMPERPEWLRDMFARSAVSERPDTCVVFGAEWNVPPQIAGRYSRVFIYCTSRWSLDVPSFAGGVDRFIVPSYWAQAQLDERRRALSCVVPHGVDLEVFKPARRTGGRNGLRVLTVTTASRPSKRLDRVVGCFLEAFPTGGAVLTVKVPSDVFYYGRHLLDLDTVKTIVKDERVTFLPGPISEEELAELYRQHDVFLYASEWETFGLSVAEARACGLSLVVEPVTALAEQLEGADIRFSADRLRACAEGAAFKTKTKPITWAQSAQLLAEVICNGGE